MLVGQTDRDVYKTYCTRLLRERHREEENWGFYDGTEYGQWNDSALRLAAQEYRSVSTFNLTKKYIDVSVGSLLNDPFELRYDTELGDDILPAHILNHFYLEDKDLGRIWYEYKEILRAGFVYRGVGQFFKDRSKDQRGRVGFRYIRGDQIRMDPNRRTANINDNENIFMGAWMPPTKIKNKYSKKSEELDEAVRIWKENPGGVASTSATSEVTAKDQIFDTSDEFFDNKNGAFLVIDRYYLKQVKYYDILDAESGVIIATLDEEKADVLIKVYKLNGRKTKSIERIFNECWVRTTCPGLSLTLVLQDGKYEYQFNGYPFVEYMSDAINGRPNTWVDILKDAQTQFNKRLNTITHILMTKANNCLMIESDAFDSDEDAKEMGRTHNRPGSNFIVRPGTNSQKKIAYLDSGNPPNDYANSANNIWSIIRELTPAVPSMQAMGEKDESGILYNSKLQQAQTSLQIPNLHLQNFWETFGDLYMMASKQTYVYPMFIQLERTGEVIALNTPGGFDMKTIARVKVNVSQSPQSETNRRLMLQTFLAISPNIKDPYTLQELSRIVIASMPNVPDHELEKLKESAKVASEVQKKELIVKSLQLDVLVMQLQQQMQMGMNPQMAGPGGQMQLPSPEGQVPNQKPQDISKVMNSLQGGGALPGGF